MNSSNPLILVGQKSRLAANALLGVSEQQRMQALIKLSELLIKKTPQIIKANNKDLEQAKHNSLSFALIDRLELTPSRIESMVHDLQSIIKSPAILGEIIQEHTSESGLHIIKERIPLGVIGMVFESRPNVIIDATALIIKSGNALILKGGKEASFSNHFLGELINEAFESLLPSDCIQVLDSNDRSGVLNLITLTPYIDLMIPRGGESLIHFVHQNATVPVIAHFKGLCHIYIHKDAALPMAKDIVLNAKTSRPGVCNAVETLLIHEQWGAGNILSLIDVLKTHQVQVRGCDKLLAIDSSLNKACEQDWETEYLDNIISIKLVCDQDQAIVHIQKYGSHHTEAIISESPEAIKHFCQYVDASCLCINASTRFNDGAQLGLGAEIGISTTKIHAYGPMGAKELTTSRFVVTGQGHIRK